MPKLAPAEATRKRDPDLLRQIPLFAGLTEAESTILGRLLRGRRYERGDTIFRQGDPGTCLYLISTGVIKITRQHIDGREIILALLGVGDVFGELALLDGETRSADAIVQAASEVLVLDRDPFIGFLDKHPKVAARLLATLSRRLRHTDDLVQDAAFLEVRARLARLILSISEGKGGPDRLPPVRLTQADLAALIGASRESVNRWLKVFVQKGAIRIEKGVLHIVDREALRAEL
jgi:CRP-like cAMP-binding protein